MPPGPGTTWAMQHMTPVAIPASRISLNLATQPSCVTHQQSETVLQTHTVELAPSTELAATFAAWVLLPTGVLPRVMSTPPTMTGGRHRIASWVTGNAKKCQHHSARPRTSAPAHSCPPSTSTSCKFALPGLHPGSEVLYVTHKYRMLTTGPAVCPHALDLAECDRCKPRQQRHWAPRHNRSLRQL
jgi:hypothetical protein